MEEAAGTPGLHPLLAGRWSPTVFDPSSDLTPSEVELLLEAARWAPSAGNSGPGPDGTASHGSGVQPVGRTRTRFIAVMVRTTAPS